MTVDQQDKYRAVVTRGKYRGLYTYLWPTSLGVEDHLRRGRDGRRIQTAAVCAAASAVVGKPARRQRSQPRPCVERRRLGDGGG